MYRPYVANRDKTMFLKILLPKISPALTLPLFCTD